VRKHPAVAEVFDLAKQLQNTFALGRGGALFRGVAAANKPGAVSKITDVDGRPKKITSAGGTISGSEGLPPAEL